MNRVFKKITIALLLLTAITGVMFIGCTDEEKKQNNEYQEYTEYYWEVPSLECVVCDYGKEPLAAVLEPNYTLTRVKDTSNPYYGWYQLIYGWNRYYHSYFICNPTQITLMTGRNNDTFADLKKMLSGEDSIRVMFSGVLREPSKEIYWDDTIIVREVEVINMYVQKDTLFFKDKGKDYVDSCVTCRMKPEVYAQETYVPYTEKGLIKRITDYRHPYYGWYGIFTIYNDSEHDDELPEKFICNYSYVKELLKGRDSVYFSRVVTKGYSLSRSLPSRYHKFNEFEMISYPYEVEILELDIIE